MKMMGLISIVMSVYNEKPEWLTAAIESIINQTYEKIEFIIVMDNPKNIELIELIKTYQKLDKRIKFFVNNKNMGLVFSLNKALEHATGQYIARMDADDVSHTDRLERQLSYLTRYHLDLIGSNITLFNERGVFHTTNKLRTHTYIKKMLQIGTIGIVHPTFFARREVFEELNGYNNSLHTEDKDFLARAICHHFKVGNTKDVLLDCRYSSDSITKTNGIYIYKIGSYVTRVFRSCLIDGQYNFDETYYINMKVTEEDKAKYNRKQILMGEGRKELAKKSYIRFVYKMIQALHHARSATFSSIKINIFMKVFKILENIELRAKSLK
jgi:glycosyltransferase involved in cell wall biosynthesis